MRHIRIDEEIENSRRKFACGLGPDLPEGDSWVDLGEVGLHHTVDCKGCMPSREQLGTPLSQISGRPGHPGYEKFKQISDSWGYP